MLQRDRQIRTLVNQLTDGFLFAFSYWLAYALRGSQEFTDLVNSTLGAWLSICRLDGLSSNLMGQPWNYFVIVPAAPLILEALGFYNRAPTGSRLAMLWSLFRGCAIGTIGLVLVLYALKEVAPRGVMTCFGLISFLLVWLKEEALAVARHSQMAKAQYKRRVILAGIPAETARLRREILDHPGDSIEVSAEFNLADSSIQELIELLHEHSVSGVIVGARHTQFERVENIIKVCEIEGVEAWLVADFFATQIAHASFDEMLGHPLIVFRSAPETSWQMLAKLLLDFFGTLFLLLLAAVPMLIIALVIKITSPGPVLFRQQRSGLNGSPFVIFKFRTMMTNAEQFKHELAAMNEMSGPVFKVTNDPRITPIGKWLRRWSLDELPQLFNVLRGEMSLVGPRPLPVDEVKRFNDLAHRRRLSVKPGLTCLWQIGGRNKISDFKEWVRLDLEYIDNWSIWLDLSILLRTVPAVLRATGAK